MCEAFSQMLCRIVTINTELSCHQDSFSAVKAMQKHSGFVLCQLSQAEVSFLSISVSVQFWNRDGHVVRLWK